MLKFITVEQFLSFDIRTQKRLVKNLSEENIAYLMAECEKRYSDSLPGKTGKANFSTLNKYANLYSLLYMPTLE